jgi:hypothetical protein
MLSTLVQLRRLQGTSVDVRTPVETIRGFVISVSFHSVWLQADAGDVIVPLRKIVEIRVVDADPANAAPGP